MNDPDQLTDSVERFRETRRRFEEAVLPLATSLDGGRFSFQASLHGLPFEVGGYVAIEDSTGTRLAQVLSLQKIQVDVATIGFGTSAGEGGLDLRSGVPVRQAAGVAGTTSM